MSSAKFNVEVTRRAEKDLARLPPETRLKVIDAIEILKHSPFPRGNLIKKIKGFPRPWYRLRIGDYRAVYEMISNNIAVLFVADKKDVETRLKALSAATYTIRHRLKS